MALDPRITVMPDGSYFYSGSVVDEFKNSNEVNILQGKSEDGEIPSNSILNNSYFIRNGQGYTTGSLRIDTTREHSYAASRYDSDRDVTMFDRRTDITVKDVAAAWLSGKIDPTLHTKSSTVRSFRHARSGAFLLLTGYRYTRTGTVILHGCFDKRVDHLALFAGVGHRIGQTGIRLFVSPSDYLIDLLSGDWDIYESLRNYRYQVLRNFDLLKDICKDLCRDYILEKDRFRYDPNQYIEVSSAFATISRHINY